VSRFAPRASAAIRSERVPTPARRLSRVDQDAAGVLRDHPVVGGAEAVADVQHDRLRPARQVAGARRPALHRAFVVAPDAEARPVDGALDHVLDRLERLAQARQRLLRQHRELERRLRAQHHFVAHEFVQRGFAEQAPGPNSSSARNAPSPTRTATSAVPSSIA
jgi:hypothetical protein